MAHIHSVYDGDTHFKIDPVTMAITNASDVKALKRKGHAAEWCFFTRKERQHD